MITYEWKKSALDDILIEDVKANNVYYYWAKILDRRNSLGNIKCCARVIVVRATIKDILV